MLTHYHETPQLTLCRTDILAEGHDGEGRAGPPHPATGGGTPVDTDPL